MDRNAVIGAGAVTLVLSLSARRAWIEIPTIKAMRGDRKVALRKESVDRNEQRGIDKNSGITVALRKESVDRNGGGL